LNEFKMDVSNDILSHYLMWLKTHELSYSFIDVKTYIKIHV